MKYILIFICAFFSATLFADTNNNRCVIKTQVDFGATTVSVKALNSDTLRKCLVIQNKSGASTVYIKFNSAHTGTEGIALSAGSLWNPIVMPAGPVYLEGSAGVVNTAIIEGN